MRYGYCIITNSAQRIDCQQKKITEKYPDCKVLHSNQSNQTILNDILKVLKEGDTIIVTDTMKLQNNDISFDTDFNITFNIIYQMYQNIFNTGADIEILSSPTLNSAIYRASLKKYHDDETIKAVSEILETQLYTAVKIEFDYILEHKGNIKTGIKTSKRRGGIKKGTKIVTRKEMAAKEYMKTHLVEFGGSKTNIMILEELGLANNTFYKYKRELLEQFPDDVLDVYRPGNIKKTEHKKAIIKQEKNKETVSASSTEETTINDAATAENNKTVKKNNENKKTPIIDEDNIVFGDQMNLMDFLQ